MQLAFFGRKPVAPVVPSSWARLSLFCPVKLAVLGSTVLFSTSSGALSCRFGMVLSSSFGSSLSSWSLLCSAGAFGGGLVLGWQTD